MHNPNRLAFTIKLPMPSDSQPSVPLGVRHPKTFVEVGTYLHHLLVIEIAHGSNPFLLRFKNKPSALVRTFKTQYTAYAQGIHPFGVPLGPGQTPREYWCIFEGTEDGGVLAVSV